MHGKAAGNPAGRTSYCLRAAFVSFLRGRGFPFLAPDRFRSCHGDCNASRLPSPLRSESKAAPDLNAGRESRLRTAFIRPGPIAPGVRQQEDRIQELQ